MGNASEKRFTKLLTAAGLKEGQHIIVHSSFKKVSGAFENISIPGVISSLKNTITQSGSIIMPAFTYNYKIKYKFIDVFSANKSRAKVGVVAEYFRNSGEVIRTSSPTHSFSLWGKIREGIDGNNSPESPLGKGSVLEWMAERNNSYVLLLGVDFSSLTFGHYLEIKAPVPWYNFSPWKYMNVEPIGVSENREQILREVPGCSKSFTNFEQHLQDNNIIKKNNYNGMDYYFVEVKLLLQEGLPYFKNNYKNLLCRTGTCLSCDERRKLFLS